MSRPNPSKNLSRRLPVVVVVGTMTALLVACGSSQHPAAAKPPASSTTSSTASTTVATTTTTAPPPAPVAPLTGLPPLPAIGANRPALVIKIDNINAARPQTGLNQADVVYEEEVEGGLTRLAAVFQSQDANPVGPIRSGRLTDIDIIDDLNRPLFAFSGAQAGFLAQIRAQPIVDVDAEKESPTLYFRDGTRPAPDNLYSRTTALYALAPTGAGPPPALFQYRPAGQPATGAGVGPLATASLSWPAATAGWVWNAANGTWVRTQNGYADVDRAGVPVTATNVVLLFVNYITDGYATGEGNKYPVPIPKGQLVGSGQVWVMTGGALVKGTWTRASLTQVATYTDSAGAPLLLAPGRTWIELLPTGRIPTTTP